MTDNTLTDNELESTINFFKHSDIVLKSFYTFLIVGACGVIFPSKYTLNYSIVLYIQLILLISMCVFIVKAKRQYSNKEKFNKYKNISITLMIAHCLTMIALLIISFTTYNYFAFAIVGTCFAYVIFTEVCTIYFICAPIIRDFFNKIRKTNLIKSI